MDYAVGTPNEGNGAVRVYSTDGTLLYTLTGPGIKRAFGGTLALADLNNDQHADIVIGAPSSNGCTVQEPAYVRVVSGSTGLPLYDIPGNSNDSFGASMAIIGDVNGDGVKDIVIGAPTAYRQTSSLCSLTRGKVEVRSGRDGSLIRTHSGIVYGENFGTVVGAVGDVNGDGVADYAASTLYTYVNGGNTLINSVRVYSGASGALLYTLYRTNTWGYNSDTTVGGPTNIDTIGDINNDGKADFILGIPAGGPSLFAGQVDVISGADGTVLYSVAGDGPHANFGHSVKSVLDYDGDGYRDFLAGAPSPSRFNIPRYVKLISGRTGAVIASYSGKYDFDDGFGAALADLNSRDAQNHPRFVIGAPLDTGAYGTNQGRIDVYFATKASLPPTQGSFHLIKNKIVTFY
jgi:hypothetical protein